MPSAFAVDRLAREWQLWPSERKGLLPELGLEALRTLFRPPVPNNRMLYPGMRTDGQRVAFMFKRLDFLSDPAPAPAVVARRTPAAAAAAAATAGAAAAVAVALPASTRAPGATDDEVDDNDDDDDDDDGEDDDGEDDDDDDDENAIDDDEEDADDEDDDTGGAMPFDATARAALSHVPLHLQVDRARDPTVPVSERAVPGGIAAAIARLGPAAELLWELPASSAEFASKQPHSKWATGVRAWLQRRGLYPEFDVVRRREQRHRWRTRKLLPFKGFIPGKTVPKNYLKCTLLARSPRCLRQSVGAALVLCAFPHLFFLFSFACMRVMFNDPAQASVLLVPG